MISKKEAKAIKAIFGVGFADKISGRLKKKGIRNRNGEAFKPHSVKDVLRQTPHSVLEEAIREVWKDKIREREQEKENLLQRSKALLV